MDIDDFLDSESSSGGNTPSPPEPEVQPEPGSVTENVSTPKTDLLEEIREIKDMIAAKRFEEVEKRYMQAKERYSELVNKHKEEQNKVYNGLQEVNQQMVQGLEGFRQETEKNISVIGQLLAKGYDHLNAGALDQTEQLYTQIEAMVKNLPDLVPAKKIKLEQDVAAFHMALNNKMHNATAQVFQAKHANIRALLKTAFDEVQRGRVQEAKSMYQRINSMYVDLPKGFLYEKAVLYQQILKLSKLVHTSQQGTSAEVLPAATGVSAAPLQAPPQVSAPAPTPDKYKPTSNTETGGPDLNIPDVPPPPPPPTGVSSPAKRGLFGFGRKK